MDGLLDNDQSAEREEEGKEGTVLTSSSPSPRLPPWPREVMDG